MSGHTVWQHHPITPAQRAALKRQAPFLLWFTGLSGSGKSTIANALDVALHERGYHTFVLDGDNVRHGLSRDLGFSADDRSENIRRLGEVCKLFLDAGLIVMSAFISPFERDREWARERVGDRCFVEVFMDTPLKVCEQRDPKGLYRQARSGEMTGLTGIDSPYEPPAEPDVRLDTSRQSIAACVEQVIDHLEQRGLLQTHT